MTPTSRTLKYYRDLGNLCDVSEYWQAFHGRPGGIRKDLFGFIDIVVLGERILAVQCTSTSSMSARVRKIREECGEAAQRWLEAGGEIVVMGWKKYVKAVDRKYWRPTIREIKQEDLRDGV